MQFKLVSLLFRFGLVERIRILSLIYINIGEKRLEEHLHISALTGKPLTPLQRVRSGTYKGRIHQYRSGNEPLHFVYQGDYPDPYEQAEFEQ